MSGYGTKELTGTSFYEFVHAADAENVQKAFQNRKWIIELVFWEFDNFCFINKFDT